MQVIDFIQIRKWLQKGSFLQWLLNCKLTGKISGSPDAGLLRIVAGWPPTFAMFSCNAHEVEISYR